MEVGSDPRAACSEERRASEREKSGMSDVGPNATETYWKRSRGVAKEGRNSAPDALGTSATALCGREGRAMARLASGVRARALALSLRSDKDTSWRHAWKRSENLGMTAGCGERLRAETGVAADVIDG